MGRINCPPLLSSGSYVSSPWHSWAGLHSALVEVNWVSGPGDEIAPEWVNLIFKKKKKRIYDSGLRLTLMLRGGCRRTIFPAGVIVAIACLFVCLLNERSSWNAFMWSRKSGLEQSGHSGEFLLFQSKCAKKRLLEYYWADWMQNKKGGLQTTHTKPMGKYSLNTADVFVPVGQVSCVFPHLIALNIIPAFVGGQSWLMCGAAEMNGCPGAQQWQRLDVLSDHTQALQIQTSVAVTVMKQARARKKSGLPWEKHPQTPVSK